MNRKQPTIADLLRMQYERLDNIERQKFEKLLQERLPHLVQQCGVDASKHKEKII